MLAIFYRQDRLRLVWQEERSRVLLAALQCTGEGPAQGQVGGGGGHMPACLHAAACSSCVYTRVCRPPVAVQLLQRPQFLLLHLFRLQVVWLANVHLEASPYRPNDRISQLRSALQRLQAQFSSRAGGLQEAAARMPIGCGPGACPNRRAVTGEEGP